VAAELPTLKKANGINIKATCPIELYTKNFFNIGVIKAPIIAKSAVNILIKI